MGIFKKTIKYSKPSKDLDHKIKKLDEELKQTGVIENQNDPEVFVAQESFEKKASILNEEIKVDVQEKAHNWRESTLDEVLELNITEEYVEEIREKHRKLSLVESSIETIKVKEAQNIFQELYQDQVEQVVEKYVSSQSKDIVSLREELFIELKKKPTVDISSLEEKINLLTLKYKKLSEGLLNDPLQNSDPLTQSPITIEQLKNHYQLLVSRLQEQLATLGGGGEVRLRYLDDVVGIKTNPSAYDGKFLKYDHSLGQFVFETVSGGGGGGNADYASVAGIATYATSSGLSTYASISGIATYATRSGISTYSTSAGIATYASNAGIATYATTSGIATYASTAGIATYATSSGIATYASTAGIVTYATRSGIATYASVAGISTNVIGGIASVSQLSVSGISTFQALNSYVEIGDPTYYAGVRLFSGGTVASVLQSGSGDLYLYSHANREITLNAYSIFGDSVNAGNVQLNNGNTGNTKVGSAITFTSSTGRIDATSAFLGQLSVGTGGTVITTTSSGLIGIGTTNPTSKLTVQGDLNVSGVSTFAGITTITGTTLFAKQLNVSGVSTLTGNTFVGSAITMYASTGIISATSFYGNFVGSITDATNLTGGTANASTLNVSGIATISQGRIQVDAASNLRFGNLPAGSGSGRNIAIGDQVLVSLSGGQGRNIGIGELSYYDTTSGQYNIGLGIQAGQKITTGSYNVIIGGYNGQTGLDIRTSSNNVVIADGQGNIRQYIDPSGNVGIKTTVITEALTVAGIVSATGFYGSLNAGQLTGSLPAIDGSALIGVVGSGSGVVIRSNNTPVGTAGTIDFGSNLSVSFGSGIATITGSGLATYANVAGIATYASTAGVSTTSGTATYASTAGVSTISGTAGYATTAGISSAVSATININTTGIITASSFSGSGSGLTNLPAGQLTGSLPAIDGSALLNVTAAGTGVAVEDNNVNVGSATTINFGTGLDVTFASGIATVTASGGSLQSRTTVSGATTSIVNNGIGNTNITGFKSYALMKVGLSTAGWIRLYTDSTSRTNDASRSIGIDPSPGSGVIAEVITTGISTTQIITPFVMGGNLNNPADTTIYAAITNLSGTTQAITANLTILQLEA